MVGNVSAVVVVENVIQIRTECGGMEYIINEDLFFAKHVASIINGRDVLFGAGMGSLL